VVPRWGSHLPLVPETGRSSKFPQGRPPCVNVEDPRIVLALFPFYMLESYCLHTLFLFLLLLAPEGGVRSETNEKEETTTCDHFFLLFFCSLEGLRKTEDVKQKVK